MRISDWSSDVCSSDLYAGRAFLLRYGKYFLIDERKYHEAEKLFLRNAQWATFIGRFIPVIRHLISLPAGVFGMRLLPFAVFTWIGATLWCGVLVALARKSVVEGKSVSVRVELGGTRIF